MTVTTEIQALNSSAPRNDAARRGSAGLDGALSLNI
jgi:hypothetical protein